MSPNFSIVSDRGTRFWNVLNTTNKMVEYTGDYSNCLIFIGARSLGDNIQQAKYHADYLNLDKEDRG